MEPFKNVFNKTLVAAMANNIQRVWPDFPKEQFRRQANRGLEELELKERATHIRCALESSLPKDFEAAAKILAATLGPERDMSVPDLPEPKMKAGLCSWAMMPLTEYVAMQGLGSFDIAMDLLKEMTKRFTAELDLRYFIIHDPKKAKKHFRRWVKDPNEHVRRLVSEATRPRLPWAMQLKDFIEDPAYVLPFLEALKDDQSEYVRRSVANNLNDIAKDHPNLVADIAKAWLKDADLNRQRLVKHACRTLIKQGHKKTLRALGFQPAKINDLNLKLKTNKIKLGETLEFELSFVADSARTQNLILDFAIHHKKANGTTAPKVFKWKTIKLGAHERFHAQKKHSIKFVTTRRYYPGTHKLEILINGESFALSSFELAISS